jgi:hypothetical protein
VIEGRRFELPEGLSGEEERAIIRALERYLAQESPHPDPWVLAGRTDACGWGAVQVRRLAEGAWGLVRGTPFARRGSPPFVGRGDAH